MASASLIPKNGAIVLASLVADFASFDLESSQSVEVVTPYGNAVNAKNVGAGTADVSFNVGAFALAHAANTPPLLTTLPGGAAGAAAVFTLDTGVTEGFAAVVQSVRLSHARMRAAVPMAISGKAAGDVTETWAIA